MNKHRNEVEMNIVVLCGGTSTERDVSLVTGEMVCRGLKERSHNAILVDVFLGVEYDHNNIFDRENNIDIELLNIKGKSELIPTMIKERTYFFGPGVIEICQQADIVFMALHGSNGEDGKVQGVFDLMGIKYTGADSLSSGMAMSKAVSKKIFYADEISQPQGFVLKKGEEIRDPQEFKIKYPCVVKPSCGGSSIGVYFADNYNDYKDAVKKAFEYEDEIIVEDCIKGREFSVGVIKYRPLPVIEIIPKQGFYDYENKYKAGSTDEICPADISEELTNKIQDLAVKSARSLGLNVYSRIDILMDDKNECFCLEANTLPGMTPTSLLPQEAKVDGIDFPNLCEYIIEVSMEKYN